VAAYAAAAELNKYGKEAFPQLVAALGDNRQSIALRRVLPSTVGDACYCIIMQQVYALPSDYRGSLSALALMENSTSVPSFQSILSDPTAWRTG
jgi:hypothetical protein